MLCRAVEIKIVIHTRDKLLDVAGKVEGIFCVLSDKIDAEFLSRAKNLKVVSTMSAGFDHIDIKECKNRGIKVGNTPEVLTEATADIVLSLMLCVSRRLPQAMESVKNGTWPKAWIPLWMCGRDISGSTVGIIGMGRIGQAVARRLKGFGSNIIYTGPSQKKIRGRKSRS